MNASKENAQKALEIWASIPAIKKPNEGDSEFLEDFLKAAQKKLPSEAAIASDRERSRKRAAVK